MALIPKHPLAPGSLGDLLNNYPGVLNQDIYQGYRNDVQRAALSSMLTKGVDTQQQQTNNVVDLPAHEHGDLVVRKAKNGYIIIATSPVPGTRAEVFVATGADDLANVIKLAVVTARLE